MTDQPDKRLDSNNQPSRATSPSRASSPSRATSPSRAPYPSRLVLPEHAWPYPKIADYLHARFPKVKLSVWEMRLASGKIHDDNKVVIDSNTRYRPGLILVYYREVESERPIPFKEKILYQDENILVADKPHFLPVVPGGKYVNECLVYRLRKTTGLDNLVPLHRLDRETAGLVLFSTSKKSRGLYGNLFDKRQIKKLYEAIGSLPNQNVKTEWTIESRMEPGPHLMTMVNSDGAINARTKVELLESANNLGRFKLEPLTGRTHQLRLHMTMIGSQIVNDNFYPVLLPETEADYDRPLKLLACRLSFEDPLTKQPRLFETERSLDFG